MGRVSVALPLSLRFALRELRTGVRGFGVFLGCLTLGVMAIASVGSVSEALVEGLHREGRSLNGGDLTISLVGREASAEEQQAFEQEGSVSRIATLRAMVRAAGGETTLVELKAVDHLYPLVGEARVESGTRIQTVLARSQAIAEPALFERLEVGTGARVHIGTLSLVLADKLTAEPDRLVTGLSYGPRLMVSLEMLRQSGLVQPGALIRWRYRVVLPAGADPAKIAGQLNARFPQAGWDIRTRDEAAPQLKRNIDRFVMFLTLIGLTVLIMGGVGVANAVRGFVAGKRDTIATLKTLGATGSMVVRIYLMQIALLSVAGIAMGLALGATLPLLAATLAVAQAFPIAPALYLGPLALASFYGLLTALIFALWPLGRAHDVGVSALFRDLLSPERRWPRPRYIFAIGLCVAALLGMMLALAPDRRATLIYAGSAAFAFFILLGLGLAIMALVRRLPGKSISVRLALANLHRPGAPTTSVVLSFGLGLCLIVAIALIQGNILRQLTVSIPDRAPSFFLIDIPDAQLSELEDFFRAHAPAGNLNTVPMLRGRIVAVNGQGVETVSVKPETQWAVSGDRGMTFSATLPQGSGIISGAWWPADYTGPPLVSLEKGVADGLGLKVDDTLGVNVLGRSITAKIAAIREVEWETLGINFVMVFSPNTFRGAPVTHLATLTYPSDAMPEEETALLKKLVADFPSIAVIRVKETLETLARLVGQLGTGIRSVALLALIVSVLVLAGALAASQRARLYESVVLKVLGATRRQLLATLLLEYSLLGLATAVLGIALGTLAAWLVITRLMNTAFVFLGDLALAVAGGSILVTIACGLFGTWRVLGQKPAPYLRHL